MSHRVLMIGGATYTDRVLSSFVRHLTSQGGFRCSALGFGNVAGHPVDSNEHLFEAVSPFPLPLGRPRSLSEFLSLCRELAACLLPSKTLRLRAQLRAASTQMGVFRERLYERRQFAAFRLKLSRLFRGFDLYHWHTLAPERFAALEFLPKQAKLVVTPWGSDILRSSGVLAYAAQFHALQRASFITVHSLEMRELILAKYGRDLDAKIRFSCIGSDVFDVIDRWRPRPRHLFAKLGIPGTRLIVSVGNNGSPENHHLDILQAMADLPSATRERIATVVPMTYGGSPSYVATIRQTLATLRLHGYILVDKLSDDEIAQLRLATDVMIYAPTSDAFSAAICETLYAGGVLITGAWLPYGNLRRRGVPFHEIETFPDVTRTLASVIDNIEAEKRSTLASKGQVRELKSWDSQIHAWINIYHELLQKNGVP